MIAVWESDISAIANDKLWKPRRVRNTGLNIALPLFSFLDYLVLLCIWNSCRWWPVKRNRTNSTIINKPPQRRPYRKRDLRVLVSYVNRIQLNIQNNIIFQTLADCYINCTVYNGLQLLYKEKVKEDFFYTQGFTNCKPLEIRCKQIICTAKDAFWYSFVSWFFFSLPLVNRL